MNATITDITCGHFAMRYK